MSSDSAISVAGVSKAYRIWESPSSRLTAPMLETAAKLLPGAQALQKRAARSYRDFWALKDISFEVKKGEAVGIIGRNGSGKSTLLQIIAGTLQPTSGSVQVNGRVAALLELGSGFNPEFTGRENIHINGAVLGLTQRMIEERFDEVTAFADIGDFIDQPVKTYSSGMAVRLAFAAQTMVEPEILIVDEALAVGDEAFQRKCLARIELLKSNGMAVLLVSHTAQSVIQLCDRALMLDRGRQVHIGSAKEVVHFYQKFLYASGSLQQEMRANPVAHQVATPDPTIGGKSPATSDPYEYFSEKLKSESHVRYDSHGATISECVLTTTSGAPVNHVRSGGTYEFRYKVTFEKEVKDLAFGMMITTIQGVEVAGASTWGHRAKLRSFAVGQSVDVQFRFTCLLQDGLYFFKCGIANDELGFIHRHVDVLNFKVSSQAPRVQTGLVDLGMTVVISPECATAMKPAITTDE